LNDDLKINLLIIDDDLFNILAIKESLSSFDYIIKKIFEASNYIESIKIFE
jgi:hypothetical protein